MTLTLVTIAGIAAAVVYWFPVRQWYRQSGAMRLEGARAMSGDTTFLVRDQDSTLAITIEAAPAEVWDALLHFGWPQQGRPMYEWLGRRFGYLQARGTEQGLGAGAEVTPALPVGPHSEIPVLSVDPTRILVLGRETSDRRWTWQFEVSTLNERQTRLILRARALKTKSSQALSRAVSFVLTRKMLLDIKRSAETVRSRQSSVGSLSRQSLSAVLVGRPGRQAWSPVLVGSRVGPPSRRLTPLASARRPVGSPACRDRRCRTRRAAPRTIIFLPVEKADRRPRSCWNGRAEVNAAGTAASRIPAASL